MSEQQSGGRRRRGGEVVPSGTTDPAVEAAGEVLAVRGTSPGAPPLRLEYVDPASLGDNPDNWRTHPPAQLKALGEVLADVGWAGVLMFNEQTGHLLDGHARKKLAIERGDKVVPVIIGRWTPEQEAKILLTHDPIGAMAGADADVLARLAGGVAFEGEALQQLVGTLVQQNAEAAEGPAKLTPMDPQKPPAMTWVLMCVPTVEFGRVSPLVEQLAALPVPGLKVETSSNNG